MKGGANPLLALPFPSPIQKKKKMHQVTVQGGESRGLNDRVHGVSCLYSDKTCKKINNISTNTFSIIMQ